MINLDRYFKIVSSVFITIILTTASVFSVDIGLNSGDLVTKSVWDKLTSVMNELHAQNGNIGVGVSSPSSKLTVDGGGTFFGKVTGTEVESTGNIKASGTICDKNGCIGSGSGGSSSTPVESCDICIQCQNVTGTKVGPEVCTPFNGTWSPFSITPMFGQNQEDGCRVKVTCGNGPRPKTSSSPDVSSFGGCQGAGYKGLRVTYDGTSNYTLKVDDFRADYVWKGSGAQFSGTKGQVGTINWPNGRDNPTIRVNANGSVEARCKDSEAFATIINNAF